MNNFIIKNYFKLFQFIAAKRIENNDLPERVIHTHLVSVLATGALMWAYAFLAFFTIASPIPAIVGFVTSSIHLASPIIFRFSNNRNLSTNIFLAAGVIHQATFGFYTGGFLSNIIIWFGILPFLAGIICGRRGVILWLIVTSIVSLGFLVLQGFHYPFPKLISHNGLLISQTLVLFGWIYVGAVVVWVFLLLSENHENVIEKKSLGVHNLICVITHDISNPLTVAIGRANTLKHECKTEGAMKSLKKLSTAINSISSIVDNVRNLYAAELGKKIILIEEVELISLFKQLEENYSDKIKLKKLQLVFEHSQDQYKIRANEDLLLYQIFGNLLSNAIKFSHENGRILISVRSDQASNLTTINIQDSGIGIPQEIIPNLFDINKKTSRAGTSGESGTGFGLPIVKAYVEMLGGKLSLHSVSKEENETSCGTTFMLDFISVTNEIKPD